MTTLSTYLWTAILSLLPVSELRGGIPFAMASGVEWYIAWPFAAAVNALVAPLCWIFLSTIHRLFYGKISAPLQTAEDPATAEQNRPAEYSGGFAWYRMGTFALCARRGYRLIFDRFVKKARAKLQGGVEKWGALGIALFVAIPLPITGAWTGTIGAWVLGLQKRKTLPAVILGVFIAGAIVTAVMLLGIGTLKIFIKTV
jgi:uncharacterized membrane protein